jgi:hypothetical protein
MTRVIHILQINANLFLLCSSKYLRDEQKRQLTTAVLYTIDSPAFDWKDVVPETGLCLRLRVEPNQMAQ